MRILILASFLVLPSLLWGAGPQQLLPLKRLTVGPFDNFQTAVDKSEKFLYYTRSQNLSSQLMRLDLGTGLAQELTPPDADAQSPVLSPDDKVVAFTYFKDDAKGDICILEKESLSCLTQAGRVEHSPFWISEQRLAYVASNDAGTQSQILVYNLSTKKTEKLTEGQIYAPTLSPDGQTLAYKARSNELVLFELASQKVVQTLTMKLPGVTGPARFSHDGSYLYFAQYMVDSNRDLALDGRDAAAIFRVSLRNPEQPEQLTSLEQNCSYPFPAVKNLYVTCAFEGALDIYRSPLEGTVPKTWVASDLWDAHQSARSYADRILLLNHLYVRFQAFPEQEFHERNLSNFIFMDAYLPAAYFAKKLADTQGYPPEAGVEQLLLETYARWEVLPQKRNLGQFADILRVQEKKLKKIPATPLHPIAQAYFDFFANQSEAALKGLSSVSEDPRVLHWKTRLERLLLRDKDPKAYRQSLAARSLTPSFTLQTQLYYLSLWLEERAPGVDPSTLVDDFKGRLASVPQVKELVDHEMDLYRVVKSADQDETTKNYQLLVERVKRLKQDYFPLRLLFNRSMIVLSEAKRTREMADIVSLWLSYLKRDGKEYPYAIEGMRRNMSDIAYRFWQGPEKEKSFAGGAFFSSIRTADDLESHYSYVLLNLEPSRWATLEKSYKMMQKDGLIRPESVKFVEIVRQLQTAPNKAETWEKAIPVIEALPDDYVGLGMKYLLLGYLYQRQLVSTQKGWEFDRDLADRAHRSYLFAIDAAYGNDRILAAALQNLALLHSHLRNYTLAAEFYLKREELPFLGPAHETAHHWLKARVMYLSYRPLDALASMEKALALQPAPREAFLEKAAFYAANAQDFPKAVTFYQQYFATKPEGGRAGIWLSYGYALRGAGKAGEAEKVLLEAMARSAKEKAPSDPGAPALVYQPEKVRFIALGLLARTEGLSLDKRREYLKQRLALFPRIREAAKLYHFQDEALSDQQIKETQDLAWLGKEGKDLPLAMETLQKSLALTQKHGEEFSFLSSTVLISVKNAMIFSREQQKSSPAFEKLLGEILSGTHAAYKEQSNPGALVTQKWGELRLLEGAYRLKEDASKREKFAALASALMEEENFKNLAKDKPDLHLALQSYQKGLAQTLN